MKRLAFPFFILLALLVSFSFTSSKVDNYRSKNRSSAVLLLDPVHNVTKNIYYATIQSAIDDANAGDHITVSAGSYLESASNRWVYGNGPHKFGLFIDKDNLTIEGLDASNNAVTNPANAAAFVTTNATNNFGVSGIFVQANGVTIKGLKIGNNYNDASSVNNNKTIEVIGNNFTLTNSWIKTDSDEGTVYLGQWGPTYPISSYALTNNKFENALVSINSGVGTTGARSGRVITGNEFSGIATPYIIGFRGWNGAGAAQGWITEPVGGAVITGNTFNNTGVDKYIVARGNAGGYVASEFDWNEIWTNNTFGNHVITLANYGTFDPRTYTDGAGYPMTRRISPLIQENVDISASGDVVLVGAGNYGEDVAINKSITLQGSGATNTTVTGQPGGDIATIRVAASNVNIKKLTVTRTGNNPTDWNNSNLNSAGIAVQSSPNSVEVTECTITGNRTGIDINNSNDNKIHNNTIDNNHTGIIFRNQTDNTSVQNNYITNNRTVGILFLDGSNGSNSPQQSAANSNFNYNDISGNWYAQVADRQTGGSLPAPGSNIKNFKCNWYGSSTPTITTNATSEPGYASLIPVAFGGSATAPGGQPDIAGPASANIKYITYLTSGTDTDPSAVGFQPDANSCSITLPVVFSNVMATLNGESLAVNWTTLSERNNSHFDIEASNDGVQFYKIGTVTTQSNDTNSGQELLYNFTTQASQTSGLMGISLAVLGLGLIFANRKNKAVYLMVALLGTGLWMGSLSCNKNETAIDTKNSTLFIRIAQVDKDGSITYSKIVKAIKQ